MLQLKCTVLIRALPTPALNPIQRRRADYLSSAAGVKTTKAAPLVQPLSGILKLCYLLVEQPLIGLSAVASLHLLAPAMPTEVPVFGGVMTGGTEDPAKAGIEANKVPTANAPIIVSLRIAKSSPAKTRFVVIMSNASGQYAQHHDRCSVHVCLHLATYVLVIDFANYFSRFQWSAKQAGGAPAWSSG